MLETIGVSSMNDLLVDIPQTLRLESLQLPAGLSEFETMAQVTALANRNRVFADRLTFRGGGVYRRFIPAAVAAVTSKPEFYTAYTPYQAEASQGTLQAIFEFQTLIAELTALDVSNASLYDGATAVAEAAMMAYDTPAATRCSCRVTSTPSTCRCFGHSVRAVASKSARAPNRTRKPRRSSFSNPTFWACSSTPVS